MKFIFFYADKRQSLYKLVLSLLMEVTRHVQSTHNGKLVIFLQYIKKKLLQPLLCSAKHLDILWGSSQVHCYTCSLSEHLEQI